MPDTAPDTARRYAGQSAAERDARRRERLLAAGLELFGTVGYAATSVERLCATAKVSTRHFYLLYTNKEAAFLDVYDEISRRCLEAALVELTPTGDEPVRDRLPAAVVAYLGPTVEDMRAARIAFVEVMGVSPQVEERRLSRREALVDLVVTEGAAAVERGETVGRDFRFATLALTGGANAIIYDWAVGGSKISAAELKSKIADLAMTLLTA